MSTLPGTDAYAPSATVIECTFCGHLNQPTAEEDPLCRYCGLSLQRLLAITSGAPTPQPAEPAPPSHVAGPDIVPGKRQKKAKRRSKKNDTTPPPWNVSGPPALPETTFESLFPAPVQVPNVVTPEPSPDFYLTDYDMEQEALEETVVAGEATIRGGADTTPWVLRTEAGDIYPLTSHDIVVGRRPAPVVGAAPVSLTDPTKTLSRTHARLRYDATSDAWTVEDLGSVNGVATVDSDTGKQTPLASGAVVVATEYLLIGTLRTQLVPLDTQ